ncbi:HNH nuclease [uncultured Caudovirales phage]|uniref:HNH nuclease n=1 Tax=uncultured Caudovirales phage TaxID=2100421 RepID=A0A6J7WSK4_9CAUD|nr:HNH nuclease [uncultured Caudovirales phage]CAB5220951.1 HNH nuclease [uncultured Caudovirales phage]
MEDCKIKLLVKERINYDPTTGKLTWKERDGEPWFNENKAGKQCGNIYTSKKDGYTHHRVILESSGERVHLGAARIAWLLMTGDWPKHTIDHKNRISIDHRWDNLSDVTQKVNNNNKGPYKSNRTGFCGVSNHNGKYWARFSHEGKTHLLGHFEDPVKAAKAYDKKAKEVLGDAARLNFPE